MTTMRVLELKIYLAVLLAMVGALALAGPALAHEHEAQPAHHGAGQELANWQNHGPFNASGVTCGGDPAAYGLESAHHGPDSGTPGKADGCYQADSFPPANDDTNPAID